MRHIAPNVTMDPVVTSDSLHIVDQFVPQIGPPLESPPPGLPKGLQPLIVPHGIYVTDAALATGYQGKVNTQQSELGANKAYGMLSWAGQTPESTLQCLDLYAQASHINVTMAAAKALQQPIQDKVTGSVINFSMGASSANTVNSIYSEVRAAWSPAPPNMSEEDKCRRFQGENMLNNLAKAWDLKPDDLKSSDPAISGPARAKFQQNLIDRVHKANQHSNLSQADTLYSKMVDAYESNHNSVVVAGENTGHLLEEMMADNGSRDLALPDKFFNNVLGVPNATTVGALDNNAQGQVGVAGYSSPGNNLDVVAWGNLSDRAGTSFAAPRVAALMQRLQHEHPDKTSSEIEAMMIQRFFQNNPGTLPSETPGAVTEYMSSQKW